MAAKPTDAAKGKSSSWPDGEPKKIRDAADGKPGNNK